LEDLTFIFGANNVEEQIQEVFQRQVKKKVQEALDGNYDKLLVVRHPFAR